MHKTKMLLGKETIFIPDIAEVHKSRSIDVLIREIHILRFPFNFFHNFKESLTRCIQLHHYIFNKRPCPVLNVKSVYETKAKVKKVTKVTAAISGTGSRSTSASGFVTSAAKDLAQNVQNRISA